MRPPHHIAEGGVLMNHDEFVSFLAEHALSFRSSTVDVEIETEAHYNYYGTRGVADLVTNTIRQIRAGTEATSHVFEAKTHLGDAHEVIRQFKKMSRFFYKDEDRVPPERVTYELTVLPTKENIRHLDNYRSLYQSLTSFPQQNGYRRFISFRGPKIETPIILFPSDQKWQFPGENWWEYAQKNPKLSKLKSSIGAV